VFPQIKMNNADLEKLQKRLDEQENKIESICRENRLLKRLMIPLGIGCLVLIGSFLWGSQITIPNTFSGGTLITASQINANFSALVNESNAQDARISNLEKIRIHKPLAYQASVASLVTATGTVFRSGNFSSQGGDLLIFPSISLWTNSGTSLQVDIRINGTVRSSMRRYTNEVNSHKNVVSDTIFLDSIPSGNHTVELVLVSGRVDTQDFSQVTILEIPN